MDFDDTWHPATHPSGAVLPAVLALSDLMPSHCKPSGLNFLLAFNVGIEIQGRLLRFSNEAQNIPKRSEPEDPRQMSCGFNYFKTRFKIVAHIHKLVDVL